MGREKRGDATRAVWRTCRRIGTHAHTDVETRRGETVNAGVRSGVCEESWLEKGERGGNKRKKRRRQRGFFTSSRCTYTHIHARTHAASDCTTIPRGRNAALPPASPPRSSPSWVCVLPHRCVDVSVCCCTGLRVRAVKCQPSQTRFCCVVPPPFHVCLTAPNIFWGVVCVCVCLTREGRLFLMAPPCRERLAETGAVWRCRSRRRGLGGDKRERRKRREGGAPHSSAVKLGTASAAVNTDTHTQTHTYTHA